jgi:hypothetical protein
MSIPKKTNSVLPFVTDYRDDDDNWQFGGQSAILFGAVISLPLAYWIAVEEINGDGREIELHSTVHDNLAFVRRFDRWIEKTEKD